MGQINGGFRTFSGYLEAFGPCMSVLSHSGPQVMSTAFASFILSTGAGLLVAHTRHETLGKALNMLVPQFSHVLIISLDYIKQLM